MSRPLRIFMIAGEASGDNLGASLMRALKAENPDIAFFGVGGMRMAEEGLASIFPMKDLSVMGLAEILPKLFLLLRRIRQTVAGVLQEKPDVVITIDSPDFCFRVLQKVKAKNKSIPCIHYVAPSVWAWRPERAKKIAQFLDHVLTLLPFEPPYFHRHGLAATFVGHPVVERAHSGGNATRFQKRHAIRDSQPLVCLLPGSRASELDRLMDVFCDAVILVLRQKPNAVVALATLPHLRKKAEAFFKGKGVNPIIIDSTEEKFDCFAASTVALAASGSVSLELAVSDTPHIIAYRLSPATAAIARRMVKTPFVNLINIVLGRQAVPELIQENCTPETLAVRLIALIDRREERSAQLMNFREALLMLGLGDTQTPSQKAAKTVLSIIKDRSGKGG